MDIINNYYDLLSRANALRGEIISETILIERLIDNYIAGHFCKSYLTSNEMHLLILGDNRMSMENKKQVFQQIASTHDLKWCKEYVSCKNDDRRKGRIPLFSDLDYIILNRNIVAHCWIDTNGISNEMGVKNTKFLRFKNEVSEFIFDDNVKTEIGKIFSDVQSHLPKSLKFKNFSTAPGNYKW